MLRQTSPFLGAGRSVTSEQLSAITHWHPPLLLSQGQGHTPGWTSQWLRMAKARSSRACHCLQGISPDRQSLLPNPPWFGHLSVRSASRPEALLPWSCLPLPPLTVVRPTRWPKAFPAQSHSLPLLPLKVITSYPITLSQHLLVGGLNQHRHLLGGFTHFTRTLLFF